MLKVAAFACVWAAAWCNPAVAAAAAAGSIAAAATGAGGRSDSGNFLDDQQWLTTISQYDKEVGQWNKFRDCKLDYQACASGKHISAKCEGRCPCLPGKSTSAGRSDKRACGDLEFREVASRLRDWFKALHESGIEKRARLLQRPERSRFDTSILPICKDSLGWMFNRLDTNYDLLLDQSELGSIYLDKNEQCTKAFFNSCDTYKDSLISNNEWCYCFQRQQDPPCQSFLSNIHKQQGGKKFIGQYIPLCDEDGYYKPTQCHGTAGQCWCVDRYGNEVTGSRTHGAADCDLETSGDFASGDFHEWTDDEDDDIMNDEDEIEDDDEDEGDDDDDDHDGYI
ncbi:testican-3 isoform X4 [Notechis scutatus]|uniref:Testican-3 isoform X4 n=1 Tax=Notechis scutatus TaxID=8663 RepID=A0A6J1UV30_9SAUR|nr:testican-3 isoform X4 [Notechis scutatus]